MKQVEYALNDPHVGLLHCKKCLLNTPAWRSSGMSESFPHFYCSQCSNVIVREKDKERVYTTRPTEQMLKEIISDLPPCLCGGVFTATASPKCPGCGQGYLTISDPVARLNDPHLILIHHAVLIRDTLYSYQIVIQ